MLYRSEINKKYRHTPKGQIFVKKWNRSETARKIAKKYFLSDKAKETRRLYAKKLRLDVLQAYGNKCACCGENGYEFLAIDHINGGGAKQRKELGGQNPFYLWLRRNNYPSGFRILCHNCNQALGAYGYCPHNNLTNV